MTHPRPTGLPQLLGCLLLTIARGLYAQSAPSCEAAMQSHYDSAQRLQASQDKTQATLEFRLFLSQALRCIASARVQVGEYSAAVPAFDQALRLAPNDPHVRLDFASAALDANDLPRAKHLLETPEITGKTECRDPLCAREDFLQGRLLFATGDIRAATTYLQAAVNAEPNFEHGYALAKADLALGNRAATAQLFREMIASYGDSAAIHMDLGRAYAEADDPEDAIVEFDKALAKDSSFPEVHYCIGAAYLLRSGATEFPQAEAEFYKELALHPNDPFSLSQLGYIAMTRHDLKSAEAYLSRAAALDPGNPDPFLLLGQIYADLDRPRDAEAALRSAIAATTDASRNHYQVRGAHYQLGRLLLLQGKTQEAKREMAATQDLLLQNRVQDEVNVSGKPIEGREFPKVNLAPTGNPAERASVRDFEHRLGPAIADAYNNLGAGMASDKLYGAALPYFEQAAAWNPETEGLDQNWGRAAFAAKNYAQATVCLNRFLLDHPSAAAVREPLGMGYFLLADYPNTLRVLNPIATQLPTSPLLDYAYAESLLHTGDAAAGIARLQVLRRAHPELGVVALGLGRALADQTNYAAAEIELRSANQLRPHDPEARYQLAYVLFALGNHAEAQKLLSGFSTPVVSTDAQLLRSVALLQYALAMPAAARANLETAAKLDPQDPAIRHDLATVSRSKENQPSPTQPAGH